MIQTTRRIFSDPWYVLLAFSVFSAMMFGLLFISGYIFLEPYVVGYVPEGTEFGFFLIVVLCLLSALVIPMNIFRISMIKNSKKKMSGGVLGSLVGIISGACGCGPVGFAIISTFGSAGATASAFITNYEIPIRIGAILVLLLACYTTMRSLDTECRIRQI